MTSAGPPWAFCRLLRCRAGRHVSRAVRRGAWLSFGAFGKSPVRDRADALQRPRPSLAIMGREVSFDRIRTTNDAFQELAHIVVGRRRRSRVGLSHGLMRTRLRPVRADDVANVIAEL